jgi:hypothetical protein
MFCFELKMVIILAAISIFLYLVLFNEKIQESILNAIYLFFYCCFNGILLFSSIYSFMYLENLMYSIFSWAMPLQSQIHEFSKVQRQIAAELNLFPEETQWKIDFIKTMLSKLDFPNEGRQD